MFVDMKKNFFEQSGNNNESSEYSKKIELLREDLEQEFEEKHGNLAKDLSVSRYREEKEQWIQDKIKEAEEMEWANEKIESEVEAKKDELTGLEGRKEMYKEMKSKIEEMFGVEEDMTDEQWQEYLRKANPEDIKGNKTSVLMADISYLNLVNKLGSSKGDELIKDASKEFRKLGVKGYRHGGDEFTALPDDASELSDNIKEMRRGFEEQDIAKILYDKYGLSPNIDIGTARLQEAVKAFQELLGDEKAGVAVRNKKPLKYLNKLWTEIADQRAQTNKAVERIAILMDKYEKEPENYKNIITFLRKGAYSISDETIESFIQDDTVDKNEMIMNFVTSKQKENCECSFSEDEDEELILEKMESQKILEIIEKGRNKKQDQ
jgi:GGDEF domain-containing protein